jgi:hypothetical protein
MVNVGTQTLVKGVKEGRPTKGSRRWVKEYGRAWRKEDEDTWLRMCNRGEECVEDVVGKLWAWSREGGGGEATKGLSEEDQEPYIGYVSTQENGECWHTDTGKAGSNPCEQEDYKMGKPMRKA